MSNTLTDLVVNFTPTGMVPCRTDTPHVPLSISEIVEDVHQACELGITMVHLHARTAAGVPTSDPEIYGELIRSVRKFAPELVVCVSLSGRADPSFDYRKLPLLLTGDSKPDMGSLTLSSLNFPKQASINAPDTVRQLGDLMREKGIVPELEIFELGMANHAKYLIKKGVVMSPCYANLIVGNGFSAQLDPLHIGTLIRDLPDDCVWSLGGIGQTQLAANTIAIALGGGVRIGLEDNLHLDRAKSRLATNAELIRRVLEIAAQFERSPMPSRELRSMLALQSGHGLYGR